MTILNKIISDKQKSKKSLALLLDPDNLTPIQLEQRIEMINLLEIDYIFVGGSLVTTDQTGFVLKRLKESTSQPKIIFPGNSLHINKEADGILLLSLISGRNPDFLIGHHVISAPILKRSGLEILSTGYLLIDGGKPTTVSYISNTFPIPNDKPAVAASTALAGEMIGHKLIYLDAGSGAANPVSKEIIEKVKKAVECPIIVGGGLNTPKKVETALYAGADVIVIGNAVEDNQDFLIEVSKIVAAHNQNVPLDV